MKQATYTQKILLIKNNNNKTQVIKKGRKKKSQKNVNTNLQPQRKYSDHWQNYLKKNTSLK